MQATRLPLQEETKAVKAFPQSDQIGLYLHYLRFLLLILWGILHILDRGIIKACVSAGARSRHIDVA